MKKYLTLILLLLFGAGLLITCGEGQKEVQESVVMYKESELARLMRDMWEENMKVRESLLAGEMKVELSVNYHELKTAKPTDSSDLTPLFYSMSDHYAGLAGQFNRAPAEIKVKRFNAVVDGCVDCHKNFCIGPLQKIRKQYISVPDSASSL